VILAFGGRGQVASALARLGVRTLGRGACDLTRPGTAEAALRHLRPDAVINAAAWTDVDGAEVAEPDAARLNADAPGEMARACAALGLPFVHISTDYVFDGTGATPWKVSDPVAPLGAYGRTKACGERQVRAAGGCAVILRTSWVFSGTGRGFVGAILKAGTARRVLRVVDDQVGGPTPAADVAAACLTLARDARPGVELLHFAGAPDIDRAGFARAILGAAGLDATVEGIASRDRPSPAPRPLNCRLDCSSLAEHGLVRPDWRARLTKEAAR
jgi:dTDP-4-dehydrorhamnose reductase